MQEYMNDTFTGFEAKKRFVQDNRLDEPLKSHLMLHLVRHHTRDFGTGKTTAHKFKPLLEYVKAIKDPQMRSEAMGIIGEKSLYFESVGQRKQFFKAIPNKSLAVQSMTKFAKKETNFDGNPIENLAFIDLIQDDKKRLSALEWFRNKSTYPATQKKQLGIADRIETTKKGIQRHKAQYQASLLARSSSS